MSDPERKKREEEQSRALDIHRPSGAMILTDYLERRQEVVGVNKNDLEDILGFDGISTYFGGFGMFLLSGSVWLLVENSLDVDGFQMDALMAFCAASAIFGVASLGAAVFFHLRKRGRIQRIFDQTRPMDAANSRPKRG